MSNTVLIIGASRGLGFALAETFAARGWSVVATERTPSALRDVASRYPTGFEVETVDITDQASVQSLKERLGDRSFDILFVNAGIARAIELTPGSAAEDDFTAMMLTNAFSPVRIVERFADQVIDGGVIAVMSSELGSITNNQGSWPLYSSSKAALNMLMKCYADARPQDSRAILVVAPGWVRTDMGGPEALLSIEDSIPLVVDMVIAQAGLPGIRFMDRHAKVLPW